MNHTRRFGALCVAVLLGCGVAGSLLGGRAVASTGGRLNDRGYAPGT